VPGNASETCIFALIHRVVLKDALAHRAAGDESRRVTSCSGAAAASLLSGRPRTGDGMVTRFANGVNSAPCTASKHAVTGLMKATALDGREYDIACGQIDVGNADTQKAARSKAGVVQAGGEVAAEPTMDVEQAARAVVYRASQLLDANLRFLTVMATKTPFVGRG
jgi:NAD(P)-dependent dehydrogenase (short-subunit alcohol dehydrogenase family)